MAILQSSYSQSPSEAVVGQFADIAPRECESKFARGLVKAGYGVFKSAGAADEIYQIPNPGAAADVDAIVTAFTTSTGVQTLSGASLDGAVGATEMQPPRNFTATLNSNTDWDATNLTLIGIDHLGQQVTELIAIPNDGNATLTSVNLYRSIISVSIPEQTGTGGTATFGISALSTLTIADFRGVSVRQPVKTTLATAGLLGYPGVTATTVTADFVDGETMSVMYKGSIWAYSEEAVSDGDPVYVRVASGAGGSQLGAFRNDADSASCVLVVGAKFARDAAGAGPAWVRLPY